MEQEVIGSIPGRDRPKSLKKVLAAPSFGTQSDLWGRARTGQSSVRIMRLGVVHVKCQGHDTSSRQHYKLEH